MQQQSLLGLLVFGVFLFAQSFSSPTAIDDLIANPSDCPQVRCAGPCLNGFVINEKGCPTCECNPCRFGNPIHEIKCGTGLGKCTDNRGLCKVSALDNVYCCPNERPGCCPPGPDPALVLCLPAKCKNDFDCRAGRKCCGPCFTCVNATAY